MKRPDLREYTAVFAFEQGSFANLSQIKKIDHNMIFKRALFSMRPYYGHEHLIAHHDRRPTMSGKGSTLMKRFLFTSARSRWRLPPVRRSPPIFRRARKRRFFSRPRRCGAAFTAV